MSILHAASRVIRRAGSLNLTLEAVAREAGVSKGGLLYHFANKETLIAALIQLELDSGERVLDDLQARDLHTQGSWARANLALTLKINPARDVSAGLLAAVALNPGLLEPVRARYQAWQYAAETDGLEPGLGTLLRLAMDGLWLCELLDLAPPRGADREALVELVGRLSAAGAGAASMGAGEA